MRLCPGKKKTTLLLSFALLAGCSPERYRRSADRQVREILAQKERDVAGKAEPFSLRRQVLSLSDVGRSGEVEDLRRTPPPEAVIERVDLETGEAPAAAPATPQETPPAAPAPAAPAPKRVHPTAPGRILTLTDAVRLAFANNRQYQTQRETLYLSALGLTLVRWQYAPRFFGIVSGDVLRDSNGDVSGAISSDFGFNWLLATGARVSVEALNNLVRFFNGRKADVANTVLSSAITQPLLRGFGPGVVLEPLVQAERNVTYQVRALVRFRQTLLVDIATQYYRVLQSRKEVDNEYFNWQGLVNNLDRAQALAQGERLPRFQVDQVLQQELQARNRYVVAVRDYEAALDRFKISLDLPMDSSIGLDPAELTALEAELANAAREPGVDDAVVTAVAKRLDLQTLRDEAEDARRQVRVAADALRTQLDIRGSVNVVSGEGEGQTPFLFRGDRVIYGAGFDLNLPFDRRFERNQYVATLVAVERTARDAALFEDQVRATVRDAHRRFLLERQTYEIQTASVRLAQDRVESTNTLRNAGRAETRDVLDSQTALIDAQNSLVSALVNLAITRLEFQRDTGTLWVEPDGSRTVLPIEDGRSHA